MLQKVRHYIEHYRMIQPGNRVVLGFSGGADSVALLHVLKELQKPLNFQLYAAHVNHGLRGQAARDDAKFAEEMCRKWDIPFFLKEADIHSLSKELHISEEETGRLVRYGFFNEVMDRIKGDRIATAHHKNDQAETILHNIIRGTGMRGLTGIKPIRDGTIIRPFLDVTRQEIEDYLKVRKISYRLDATNVDSIYTRNRIRNKLLPDLEESYNPDIVDSLARMADILREEDNFLMSYCKNLYEEMACFESERVELDLRKFNNYHSAVKRRLVRMAIEKVRGDLDGVGHSHVEAVIRLAECSATGSRTLIPAGSLNKRRILAELGYNYLIFRVESGEESFAAFEKTLPVPGKVVLDEVNLVVTSEAWDKSKGFSFSPWCIYIDKDKLEGSLSLRQRRNGDRFKPFGMKGSKKLKDYFIDRKIPRDERSRIPLLVDQENIVWVVGYQINHDYRVTDATTNIIRISAEEYKTDGG